VPSLGLPPVEHQQQGRRVGRDVDVDPIRRQLGASSLCCLGWPGPCQPGLAEILAIHARAGAGYWASLVLELLSARERLWARTCLAVPAVLLFSTLTLAITLVHPSVPGPQPAAHHPGWYLGWLLVYVSVPVATSWLLVAQLRRARPEPARVAPLVTWSGSCWRSGRRSCWGWACPCCWYQRRCLAGGPGALTPLTGRAIGAWAIGIGTIAAQAAWEDDWWRLRPMMLSYTVLGLLQLTGVLRYRTDLDWSRAAAVAYVCFLATILLLGG
jgi:hypothetical protein